MTLPVEIDLLAVFSLPSDGGPELVRFGALGDPRRLSVRRHHSGHPGRQIPLVLVRTLQSLCIEQPSLNQFEACLEPWIKN